MSSAREKSRQKAGSSDNAQSSSPRRLTRDTQFIVTSVFVVGGLVLGQACLLSARFDDINQRFDEVNRRFDEVNRRIDALEERVNKRIDELQDDVREIRLNSAALSCRAESRDSRRTRDGEAPRGFGTYG